MRILVDTNILLRAVQPSHPMHASAVRAMGILMERRGFGRHSSEHRGVLERRHPAGCEQRPWIHD